MSIETIKGDITQFKGDAIVNAANKQLKGGGGVDGAIHRAGGPEILDECQAWVAKHGQLPTGQAMLTTAGKLPAKAVIHTVGPVWNGKEEEMSSLLASAYENSLKLAKEHDFKSVAFPNISTGVYGFPKDKAARIAVDTVKKYIDREQSVLSVTFVCFDEENYSQYQDLL